MIGKTNVGGGGVRGIDFGEVTLASKAESVTVSHKLGVVPSWVALIPKELPSPSSSSKATCANLNGYGLTSASVFFSRYEVTNALSETEVTFNCHFDGATAYRFPTTDYYWIAIA